MYTVQYMVVGGECGGRRGVGVGWGGLEWVGVGWSGLGVAKRWNKILPPPPPDTQETDRQKVVRVDLVMANPVRRSIREVWGEGSGWWPPGKEV